MSRVGKVGVAVKETDTERKIKLGFSDVAARSDINKEEVIINSKVRLSLSKKMFYLLRWKPFKYDEKCILFHYKISFRSEDI